MTNAFILRGPASAAPSTVAALGFATAEERAIANLSGLTGWWEADAHVATVPSFRWRSRHAFVWAYPREQTDPLVVTGSHGKAALQQGFGDASFTSVKRGALIPQDTTDYFGADGFTYVSVLRPATAGESATVGGYIFACDGDTSNLTPRAILSGSTGKVQLRSGNAQIINPPGDLRDGLWHIVVCTHDRAGGTIRLDVDGATITASNTGAGSAVPTTARVPVIGRFVSAAASPFYGQRSAELMWSRPLTSGERASVVSYLAAKYLITIT